jgi:serine/threonine protein kinase
MASVFRPGERCGPYEIVRQLGEGGMGEVHLARNAQGEARALKVLSPNAQQNRELVKRFMGEIQVLSYLEHAHVVRFFETGMLERDGRSVLWLALEFLQGRTLREVVQAHPGTLPEDTLIRWGRQIAQGVHEAHKLKVVHRDLKPENVIIVGDDMAKVIDFGIAKFRDWGDTRSRTSGAKIGTVLYMAPEQLDDALGVPIDERTDVYGLGLILYELALGRNPYVDEGGSLDMASLLVRKLAQDLPPICSGAPYLSSELGAVVDRACQHDAARRFPNMGELHDALGAVWRQRMDARRAQMLGDPHLGRAPDAQPGRASGAALDAPPIGQSSRFDSVRTLPGRESPLSRARSLRDVALLGAALGVASGLVLYRAVIEPRQARPTHAATPLPESPPHPSAGAATAHGLAPAEGEPAPRAAVVTNTGPTEAPVVTPIASSRSSAQPITSPRRTPVASVGGDANPLQTTSPGGARTVPTPPATLAPPSSVLIHQSPRQDGR